MTATSKFASPASVSPHLRPIRVPHDLPAVADLVELCFAATLDEDGRRFIRQMRRASGRNGLGNLPPTIKGFVWMERGEIVGNLNMLPVMVRGQRAYLVANVAVHPDFRRRGIAHQLTQAAITLADKLHVRQLWLQVDERNLVAQHLYHDFGFSEQARRTRWHSRLGLEDVRLPTSVQVKPARAHTWKHQRRWLKQLYGPDVRWNLPIHIGQYAPGLWGEILRLFGEHRTKQWSAFHRGEWIGSLTWQHSYSQADWLWLAAPPEKRALAILALIPQAYRELREEKMIKPGRVLAVNFPAGDAAEAFETIGFENHNTLIWMERRDG